MAQKRLDKFKTAKTMKWIQLVKVLKSLGFVLKTNKGGSSHCKFIHPKGLVLNAYRPHPGNEVKNFLLRQMRESLEEWGLL